MNTAATAESLSVGTSQQLISQQNQSNRNLADEFNDLIQRIYSSDRRDRALTSLARKADEYPSVGYTLWSTPAIIPIFLQEIIAGYPLLRDASMPLKPIINRVCNVLTLLQKVACDEKAWRPLVKSKLLHYILPYLKIGHSAADHVRVNALGIIGMVARHNKGEGISYLVYELGVFPYCIDSLSLIQDSDKVAGKIIPAFIVEKLLQHEGLTFITEVPERCRRVIIALHNAIPLPLQNDDMKKLARTCIRCFLCLCKTDVGRVLLKEMLLDEFFFGINSVDDGELKKIVKELQLLLNSI